MPLHKYFLTPLCVYLCFGFCLAMPVHAADWRACEQAKLRQLNLEQTARADRNKKTSRSRSRFSKSHQNAEQLDEWLWKNCRDYSYELRSLEQQRM